MRDRIWEHGVEGAVVPLVRAVQPLFEQKNTITKEGSHRPQAKRPLRQYINQ